MTMTNGLLLIGVMVFQVVMYLGFTWYQQYSRRKWLREMKEQDDRFTEHMRQLNHEFWAEAEQRVSAHLPAIAKNEAVVENEDDATSVAP